MSIAIFDCRFYHFQLLPPLAIYCHTTMPTQNVMKFVNGNAILFVQRQLLDASEQFLALAVVQP